MRALLTKRLLIAEILCGSLSAQEPCTASDLEVVRGNPLIERLGLVAFERVGRRFRRHRFDGCYSIRGHQEGYTNSLHGGILLGPVEKIIPRGF
jgi:hypothetical protein